MIYITRVKILVHFSVSMNITTYTMSSYYLCHCDVITNTIREPDMIDLNYNI